MEIRKNFNQLVLDHFINKKGKIDPSVEKDINDMKTYIDWLLYHQKSYSHGDKTEEVHNEIDQIRQEGFEVIKAFRILGLSDWENLYSSNADYVLVDNATSESKGGTGQTFDWSIEPPRHVTNLVLSGGLTVDNIEDGVKCFDPVIIDVNSGVESAPGIKSKPKLIEFLGKCDKIRNAK